jgi:hypothetical protein
LGSRKRVSSAKTDQGGCLGSASKFTIDRLVASPSTIASPRKPADGTERRPVERPFSDTRKNIFLARCISKMKNLNAQLDGWLAMATNVRLDEALAAGKARPTRAFSHTV